MARIKVTNNDRGTVAAMLDNDVVRSWVYRDPAEEKIKMLAAREFAEGWYQAMKRMEGE